MNRVALFQALHRVLSVSGATTGGSSSGWGWVTRGADEDLFEAAADLPDDWVEAHINERNAHALLEILR